MSADRTPEEMREDAMLWAKAGYARVAINRYRDAADQVERLERQVAGLRKLAADCLADPPTSGSMRYTLEQLARPDVEALLAVPSLRDRKALVLYFATDADREELIAAIHEAKPSMRTVKL